MSRKKLPLRICHPNGILKLGIVSDRKVQDLKALIREKLKIKTEKDYVSSEKGVISDLQWLETCKKEEELCGDAFPKRGMKVYYRYVEKQEKLKILISVSYLPPVSQTIEFEFEDPSTKLCVLFRKVRAHFAGVFDEFELENKETLEIYKGDEYERTLSDACLDQGASLRQVIKKKEASTSSSYPKLEISTSSSKTEDGTTSPKEWGLGMPCLVSITEHGPWKAGVITKVKKSKSGKETRFTVFVPDMEPVSSV